MLRLLITCYCYFMLVSRSVQVAPFRTSLWKPTEQQPCKSGKYASITSRNTTKCRYCSLCPKGQQVITDCGTHSDTVCEDCPSGSFNDVRGRTCRPCSMCKPGTYVRRYCSVIHDTRCRPCPKHRFNTVWNTEACDNCRRCKAHEKFIAKCRKNRDTQCGDCLHGYFRESFTGNCLPCSPCPYYDLRRYVVKECQTRLGIEHSDVCWPGVFTYDQTEKTTSFSDIVELDMDENKLRELQPPLTKKVSADNLEVAVDNRNLETDDELFQNTITLTTVLGVSVLAVVVFMSIVLFVRMRQFRNRIPNTTESGSFTFEGYHHEVNEYSNTVHINSLEVPQIQDNYITPETGNTCTHLSDYTLSSSSLTTDKSLSDLTPNISDVFCKSDSAPTVLKREHETVCTDSFRDVQCLTDKKKKSKRRKKKSPPDVDVYYYNIPCNPQYFSKQMYVTL